jgi:hypothetical protein
VRTAALEYHGGSLAIVASANVRLPLPNRRGGSRLIVIDATTSGLAAILPDARLLKLGGEPQFQVVNTGAHNLEIRNRNNTAVVVAALAPGASATIFLMSNTTIGGSWFQQVQSATLVAVGSAARQTFRFELTGFLYDFMLADHLIKLGWDGARPVGVQATITPGSAIGSTSTAHAAFRALDVPAGSSMLLRNQGFLVGAGGDGGGHGPNGAATAGGTALEVDFPTRLINEPHPTIAGYGTIGGGGGGGQKSAPNVWAYPGGSGGGGAGALPGRGGIPNVASPYPEQPGEPGQFRVGGRGGNGGIGPQGQAGRGGDGGDLGQPGSAGQVPTLSPPGDAGAAIVGITHVTKILAGTILGAEL